MKAFPSLCVLCGSLILFSVAFDGPAHSRPPVGSAITYQGELKNGGVALNGTADLTFQLWPTNSAVGAPSSAVVQVNNVGVTNGRFTVNLDFGAAAFNGEARFMQIRVRTPHDPGNSLPFTTLTPLQEAKPAPMAMHSLSTGLVPNASLLGTYSQTLSLTNAANTLAGNGAGVTALNASNLSSGVVGSGLLAGSYSNVLTLGNANNILAGNGAAIHSLNANQISSGNLSMTRMPTSGIWTLTDLLRIDSSTLVVDPTLNRVGIGDVTPDRNLDVYDTTQATVLVHSGSTSGSVLELKGLDPAFLGSSTYGSLRWTDAADNTEAQISFGRSLLGSGMTFRSDDVSRMHISTNGNVGIGEPLPFARLHVQNTDLGVASAEITNEDFIIEDSDAVLSLFSSNGGTYGSAITLGDINTTTGDLQNKWSMYRTTGAAGRFTFSFGADADYSVNPAVMTLRDTGRVGIGTTSPGATLHVLETTNDTVCNFSTLGDGPVVSLTLANVSSIQPALIITNTGSGPAIDAGGKVRCEVLEITGGADLSEGFNVADHEHEIIAGMVVSIDPAHPGELMPCTQAYDRKVAGIISGAGGVKTGMVMKHDGTLADGKHPVALTGRVYCLVDCGNGAIEPGDLLTTSDVPGHAMKASDHDRASGAVIGKAMTGMDRGRGLVLVLVNLQ